MKNFIPRPKEIVKNLPSEEGVINLYDTVDSGPETRSILKTI